MNNIKNHKISVGLDIGTTTICAAVLDMNTSCVLKTYTLPNLSDIPSEYSWEHIQSPVWIWNTVHKLLDEIISEFSISFIGVTGQMHGILYTSPDGTVLSPLYTWQDMRADHGDHSTCEIIKAETGYMISGGYGLATHIHLMQNGGIMFPKDYYCCTIMDYVTMRLCGLKRPVMHITDAHSWGLYNSEIQNFDIDSLNRYGIDESILPFVISKFDIIGEYRRIPVSVAIGDNQAAFIGSATDPNHTVLVNIGTGGQVSVLSDRPLEDRNGLIESRPFDGEKYLLSGSSLCGGRAYAILESFFRQYAIACGLPDGPQYEAMNQLAYNGIQKGQVLAVKTTFCGTRSNSSIRGSIVNIDENNLTPEALITGVLKGIANELHEMYILMPINNISTLIASGNAVRKNSVLQKILADIFCLPLYLTKNKEEAACGAALLAKKLV